MDVNTISTHAGKDSALPCLAQFVRILLVDHDTASLISLASQFEQQLYKVTNTESATMALSLFQAGDNYYDIVIADIGMPEMAISEFVNKLHAERTTVPIILIAKDLAMDSAREALGNGVCYIFSKPPRHSDIASVWQHIPRVTGELPALLDMTTYNDIENNGNPSSDSSSGGATRNQKGKNLKMKSIITDKGHKKRKKNQIAETSNSSNEEEDGKNSKKPRITWNSFLHEKFLHAINILREHGHEPQAKTILVLMNEPGLTYRHVASHLQKHRERARHTLNLLKTASPVMPIVLPSAPLTNFMPSSNYMATPNFMHYIGGNDGVQEPTGASDHLTNGWESLNQEPTSASIGHLGASGQLSNGWEAPNQEPEGVNDSNQQFDEMPSNDDINQFIKELEACAVNTWDLIN